MEKERLERLAGELYDALREDILERYENVEYYDPDVIEQFIADNQLTEKERKELLKHCHL